MAASSDLRISVLLDPESAQTSLGIFVFLGAAERKALCMLSFCLNLVNGELILIEDAGSVFLPWPTRQAFPPGGKGLTWSLGEPLCTLLDPQALQCIWFQREILWNYGSGYIYIQK